MGATFYSGGLMRDSRAPISAIPLTDTTVINVYEISENSVLVGANDAHPQWHDLNSDLSFDMYGFNFSLIHAERLDTLSGSLL